MNGPKIELCSTGRRIARTSRPFAARTRRDLACGRREVREELQPLLAAHDIEAAILEWQVRSVGLDPGDLRTSSLASAAATRASPR